MKLNKIALLALIGAAFVSSNAFCAAPTIPGPVPKKVKHVVDNHGKKVDGQLDVMRDGKWVRFETSGGTCAAQQKHAKRPHYQFATSACGALNVVEKNDNCVIYYPVQKNPQELSPDEKEIIMMEEVIKD
jgi:hypothetical protein